MPINNSSNDPNNFDEAKLEADLRQQLDPLKKKLEPSSTYSQELESRLQLFTKKNPHSSPNPGSSRGFRNFFGNKQFVALAAALLLLALAGGIFFTTGNTPATQEAFCANTTLSAAQVANYRNLNAESIKMLRELRGLTPQEICSMSSAKLDKALERLNPNEANEPSADSPDKYAEYEFDRQRDAKGQIPPDALLKARKQVANMPVAQPGGIMPNAAGVSPGSWNWVGPGNIGGRIRAIVIDKNSPNTIYIGGVAGGIWKSTDGGTTWRILDDFMANMAVTTLVMDPNNSNVLYAGTGEGFFNADGIRGAGIWKTTNAGTTWTQIPSTATSDFYLVNRLAISPDGTTLLAATSTSVQRSTNGGTSWTNVLPALNLTRFIFADVDFNPSDSSKAVLGGNNGRAWYSTDGGLNWTAATSTWETTDTLYNRIEVAYAPSSPNIVYASAGSSTAANNGVWKSTDGGANYTRVSPNTVNALGSQAWYDNIIAVSPTDPNLVFWAGLDIYRSTNGGTTFTKVSNWTLGPPNGNQSAHADHHNIVFPPNYDGTTVKRAYFTNDGGIFKTEDVTTVAQSSGWVNLNNNLGITQFYGGAGNAQSGVIVAGAQDNGTLRYGGNPQGWTPMFGGDGGFAAADQTDPNYFYGEYVYLTIHRSSNGGTSSSYIYTGISDASTTSPNANFIAPFILDPNDQKKLIGGGNSLWRTLDAKAASVSWSQITVPTVGANCLGTSPRSCISAIAVAKGNSDIMWFGRSNGYIYYTGNGTSNAPTWTQVDANLPGGTPGRAVNSITIDPQNPSTVYVALGGFGTNNLYKTTNNGTTWTAVSGTGNTALPQVPIYTVEVHPNVSNWIYVGTTIGLFASEDGGTNWQVAPSDGPSNAPVNQLSWMGNTLLSITHGRGVFTAAITPTIPVLNNAGYTIQDANNDGIYVPGEQVQLNFGIRNTGGATGTVVTNTLSVVSGNANVVVSSTTYPAVNINTTVTNTVPYQVLISPNAPCGDIITLRQTVGYDGGRTFSYDVKFKLGTIALQPTATYSYTGAAVFIPDNPAPGVSATQTINAPAGSLVGKINSVKISSVSHTYIGDVTFLLIAPSGKSVALVVQRGGDTSASGVGVNNLILTDSAANLIGSAPNNTTLSGTYRPENPLSTLEGEPANGLWGLYMVDGGQQDTGTLAAGGWSMDMQLGTYNCGTVVTPQLTSLNPNSVVAGTLTTTVTITGSNFISTSVANFAGAPRPTTYVSSTQLTMQLAPANLATAGTFTVTVTNPGGGVSNALTFTVTTACNPLVVTSATDNGTGTICGTFSYALANATTGNTITFGLTGGNSITFSGALTKNVPNGVTIDGGSVSGIVLNGAGVATDGLQLSGNNTVRNITLTGFTGRGIVTLGTGNKLFNVRILR